MTGFRCVILNGAQCSLLAMHCLFGFLLLPLIKIVWEVLSSSGLCDAEFASKSTGLKPSPESMTVTLMIQKGRLSPAQLSTK